MINGYYGYTDNGFNEARSIVAQMSVDDLKKLMTDDAEVIKVVRNLPEVQSIESVKESIKDNVKRLALNNIDKGPILTQEKRKLAEIHEELRKLKETYDGARGKYDDQSGETNPEMIYALLQTAASELERSTEESAEDFFYGQKTEEQVTEFERRFIEDRKHAHELKVKAEKFHELLRMSQSTSYLNPSFYGRGGGYPYK